MLVWQSSWLWCSILHPNLSNHNTLIRPSNLIVSATTELFLTQRLDTGYCTEWCNSTKLEMYKWTFLSYSETGVSVLSVLCQGWSTIGWLLSGSASLGSQFSLVELLLENQGGVRRCGSHAILENAAASSSDLALHNVTLAHLIWKQALSVSPGGRYKIIKNWTIVLIPLESKVIPVLQMEDYSIFCPSDMSILGAEPLLWL